MTHVFSRKAYSKEKRFAEVVWSTFKKASSKEHHMELIQKKFPKHTIVPLYTFEHGSIQIEKFKRCQFDSSEDAFAAYLNEESLDKKLDKINKMLN